MDTYEFLTATDRALIQATQPLRRSNRRACERLNTDLYVALRLSGKLIVQGRVSNISRHGIFVEVPVDLLPESGQVELRSYQGDVMLSASGDIVHKTAEGVGISLRGPIMMYEMIEGAQYALDPVAIAV